MTGIWESDFRLFLAPPVVVAGLRAALCGARRVADALRLTPRAAARNLRLMSGFRLTIAGCAIACVCGGWLLLVPALAVAAAIIGLGEMLETSLDVWALSREPALPGDRRAKT